MKSLLILSLFFCYNASAESIVLWKNWYRTTIKQKKINHYSEELEYRKKNKEYALSQQFWEWTTPKVQTQTSIGSIVKDDENFSPIAFHVEKKNSVFTQFVEAKVEQKQIKVKITDPAKNNQVHNLSFPVSGIYYFSSQLPFVLASQLHPMQKKKFLFFKAIVEEGKAGSFAPLDGVARVTPEVDANKCRKYTLDFNQNQSEWWIHPDGYLCRMILTKAELLIELTTETEAKKP